MIIHQQHPDFLVSHSDSQRKVQYYQGAVRCIGNPDITAEIACVFSNAGESPGLAVRYVSGIVRYVSGIDALAVTRSPAHYSAHDDLSITPPKEIAAFQTHRSCEKRFDC